MRKTLSLLIVSAVCLFLVISCGGMKQLTSDQRYVEALTLFNSVYKTYLDHYDMASSATQERWKKEIDPIIAQVSRALDIWKLAVGDGAKEQNYIALKNKLLVLLFEFKILEVKE